jgi:hypothetical protein
MRWEIKTITSITSPSKERMKLTKNIRLKDADILKHTKTAFLEINVILLMERVNSENLKIL